MINLKKWVEKPINENIKEKIKLLLVEDVDTFGKAAHLSNNDYRIIVDYLYEWIDLCCAYRSYCDIIDIYIMSLDDLDELRLSEVTKLFYVCRKTTLRDLGYLKLLRDLFGKNEQLSVSKDDIEKTTRKIIKKGGSSNVNTDND